ncbi:MAG: hypothetical protein WA708_04345 [Acidobacteriaceae bacterium]
MAKSGKNKRLTWRLAALIRALGAVPIPYDHPNEKDYAVAVQRQYEQLRHAVDPATAAQARIFARAAIRRFSLPVAASGSIPLAPGDPSKRSPPKKRKNRRKLEAFFHEWSSLIPKCPKCRMRCGLPKKSWPTLEMAEEAVKRSPKPSELHIYKCPHQTNYWHIGHKPNLIQKWSEFILSTQKAAST